MSSVSATHAFTTLDIDDDQSQQPGLDMTAFLESSILPPTCLGQGQLDCLGGSPNVFVSNYRTFLTI